LIARFPDALPEIHLVAVCHDCRRQHEIRASPLSWLGAMSDWEVKHRGHRIEFHTPKRVVPRRLPRLLERLWESVNRGPWWLEYGHNADLKLAYASSAAYTITLASLASSSTKVAGRESTAVSNASNKYLDYMVGGKVTTGTSPTDARTIEIWAGGAVNDTPLYPDVFDGTDSDETATSSYIRDAGFNFLADTATNNTSDRPYWFKPTSLAAIFGGIVPTAHVLWVTHDTGQNLNSTGGNHALYQTGIYVTSA
jgi:hypothetical protein